MYCVRRVRTMDDVLLVYFVSYFPLSLNIPMNMEEHTQSIYEVIGAPTRIDEEFSAINPSEEICLALKIRKDQPVLARKRVSYDKKKKRWSIQCVTIVAIYIVTQFQRRKNYDFNDRHWWYQY